MNDDRVAPSSPTRAACVGIRGKRQFERLVGVRWDHAPSLAANAQWACRREGKRLIQEPLGALLDVHRRIAYALRALELPAYVFPKRGQSPHEHARLHVGRHPMVQTDISLFFQSVTHRMVRRVFHQDLGCAEDVASRLADLCCYQRRHLPLGSVISGPLATLAARPMFDEIAALSRDAGCRFSVYVDDIVVSGDGADGELLRRLRDVIAAHGFRFKLKKSHLFAATEPKRLTGLVIVGEDLRVAHSWHQKAWRLRRSAASATGEDAPRLNRSWAGARSALAHASAFTGQHNKENKEKGGRSRP